MDVRPPPRREQVLAFIVEKLVREGRIPSEREMARALGISRTRIGQLVGQLIGLGQLERRPGVHGGLVVRDVTGARAVLVAALSALGANVNGEVRGWPHGQLPKLAAIEHLPDVDWPETA